MYDEPSPWPAKPDWLLSSLSHVISNATILPREVGVERGNVRRAARRASLPSFLLPSVNIVCLASAVGVRDIAVLVLYSLDSARGRTVVSMERLQGLVVLHLTIASLLCSYCKKCRGRFKIRSGAALGTDKVQRVV